MAMLNRIFVTGAGGICGAFDGFTAPSVIQQAADGRNFMTLREAADHVSMNLNFSLKFGPKHNSRRVNLGAVLGDHIVCPVKSTDRELADRAGLKPMRRERHQFFAMIAAMEAMQGITINDPEDYGCVGATGGAGLRSNFQTTLKLVTGAKLSPFDNLKYLPNIFVGDIAQRFQLRGASEVHGTACAASGDAFNSLIRMILLGEVSGGLLVGTDAAISEFGIATFARQGALGNGLTFQADRSGFVMGEGAGALFIESEESMVKAGRVPLIEVLGYASSSDANPDIAITAPDPAGQAIAARKALKMAGLSLPDLTMLSVHGTATDGDPQEIDGLELLDGAECLPSLRTFAPKTWTGHLLGAASVIEMVLLIAQLKSRQALPSRGLTCENLDPACARVRHALGVEALPHNAKVMSSSFGFAQTDATRVLQAA